MAQTGEAPPAGQGFSGPLAIQAARADAPRFWPLRLQRIPAAAGLCTAMGLLVLFWGLAGPEWPPMDMADAGTSLFFALSLALLLELAALIPRAAQRDFDVLAPALSLDGAQRSRLRRALVRYERGALWLNGLIGIVVGIGHVALTGGGWGAAMRDPLELAFAFCTLALWGLMAQTGSVLVANALLFAELGQRNARVDILAIDRLRPFATAALRPMLLIMSLLAAYPLMLLDADAVTLETAIGPVATALLALAAVWLPLRGLARRIAMARQAALARIDTDVAAIWAGAAPHSAPADVMRLEALLALRTRILAAPALPLGTGGIGRGLVYLSLPLVTWGGKGFAEAILDRIF